MNLRPLAWLTLAGVGLYLLYRTARPQGGDIGDALSIFDPFFAPNARPQPDLGSIRQYTPAPGPGNERIQQAKPISPGTAAVGAVSATGSTVAAGLTGTAAAVTAGVTAGAALLVWGIVSKGWFRGGEEALKVNPARDEFLGHFAPLDPWCCDRVRGTPGLAWLLNEMGAENGPLANIGRAYGDGLFRDLERADTMNEFTPAAQAIVNYLQRYPQRVASLEAYALAHFPMAA